jgi:hypothetical protein
VSSDELAADRRATVPRTSPSGLDEPVALTRAADRRRGRPHRTRHEPGGPTDVDGDARARRRRRVAIGICMAGVLLFYLRCGWSYGKSLDPAPGRTDFQNVTADAFAAGQLHLTIDAPPELVTLPDPFDPVANAPYRAAGLHDLSLYEGRLYTYFGPAPVVLLYLPFRLLRVGDLSPTLACVVFCSAGFLATLGAYRTMTRRWFGEPPLVVDVAATLALGVAGPAAWIIHIGRGYEAVIACAYFLVSLGAWALSRALLSPTRFELVFLALAGFAITGVVGARPNLVWVVAAIPLAAVVVWRRDAAGHPGRIVALVTLIGPCVAVGAVLAWYNWARFGSVGEFGVTYQLLGENYRLVPRNQLSYLRQGVFEYLLAPPRVEGTYPWFRLRPASMPLPTEQHYLREPVAGLLPAMPATVAGLVAYLAIPAAWARRALPVTVTLSAMAAMPLLAVAATTYRMHGATMRYQLDFAPLLLLASVLGWVALTGRTVGRPLAHRVTILTGVVLIAWSAFVATGFTMYPCAGTGSC